MSPVVPEVKLKRPPMAASAVLASFVIAAVGIVLLRHGWTGAPLRTSPGIVAALIGAGFALLYLAPIAIHVRGEIQHFSLAEVPFAFGLAYVAPWKLAGFWILGIALVQIVRYDAAWFKVLFNSSVVVLRVSVAFMILSTFSAELTSALSIVLIAVAVTLAEIVGTMVNITFMSWTGGRSGNGLRQASVGLGQSAIGAAIGAWSLVAAFSNPLFLILPTFILILVWQLSRQQMADQKAYSDLLQVHEFLAQVAELEPSEVESAGLEALRSSLSRQWASISEPASGRVRTIATHPAFDVLTRGTGISTSAPGAELSADLGDGAIVLVGPPIQIDKAGSDATLFIAAVGLLRTAIQRAALRNKLDYDAAHDPITGLLARRGFMRQVDDYMHSAGGSGAVLAINLTRFGEVNKTLGFKAGDLLLKETARRLEDIYKGTPAVLARLNADSFAVFVAEGDERAASNEAARIRTALTGPLDVRGLALSLISRIGVAIGPKHGATAEELLRAADVASDLARHAQPPMVFYRAESDLHSESRLELLTRLRRALEGGLLDVWYQPKVDAISGRVVGAEALVRWHDQDRWIPPDIFIPSAEAAGMMNELTDYVLRKALASVARWRADGFSIGVAVNLSPSSLEDPDLPGRIASELRRYSIDPPSLTIEITESVVVGLSETVSDGLRRLRSLGVRISVDDFGTGYSSLRYLKDLDIDELKLDRSFVRDLSVADRSTTIARAVIGLGHSLGLQVVAEGVETVEAKKLLDEMGCDVLQGYLIARPMDEAKAALWLERHRSRTAKDQTALKKPGAANPDGRKHPTSKRSN